jgi:diguanylate cyclase (GGDEF)-like protein/PAS domain S-box-containing protein
MRGRLWIAYLAFTGALAGLYLFVPPFAGSGPLMSLISLSSPVAIVVGVAVHRPAAYRAWLFFIVGQFLFFAGDAYTYAYPKLLGAEVPFPSPGDALYIMVYPALFAGLVLLMRRRNAGGDTGGLIDSLILTIGIAVLSWIFLIVPNLHLSGLSHLAKGVSIAYPLGDLLLLGAAIRLSVDHGKRATAFRLLVASIVALLATDSAYTRALLDNTYNHQLIYDAGWIAYYVLFGAAALHPSMRTLSERRRERHVGLTRRRLALLAGASLLAQAIRFAQEIHHPEVLAIVVASSLLYLLVVFRLAGLVRQEERSAALRSAGIELVGAVSREQIQLAASKAIRAVAGSGSVAHLVMLEDGGATIAGVAADGTVDTWRAPDVAVSWFDRAARAEPAVLGPGGASPVRDALGVDAARSMLAVPLALRHSAPGLLMAAWSGSAADQLVEGLEALAAQAALALDASSRAESEHRQRSEARFRSLVSHSSDLITVLDAVGTITFQSPSIETILGHPVAAMEGTRFLELIAPRDRGGFESRLATLVDSQSDSRTFECSLAHRDGRWRQFEIQATNLLDDEHVRGIVFNSRDISERKAFEDQLEHQAFHDPVTGLANRALFADRVRHALSKSAREYTTAAVLFIDLDEFKTINDSLGHAAGDMVLKEVARRLQEIVRQNDTVARFGGDEFAILLEEVPSLEHASDLAARIIGRLSKPVLIDGKDVYAQASIGICLADPDASPDQGEELLRNADVAMYMAKRHGKGSYRVFEHAMHEKVLERLELRTDLQRAVEADELAVHYQPVIRLSDGTVYGLEALCRWHHPQRGDVPPSQFIPLAEETGLILRIGRWILGEACREAARVQALLREEGEPLAISVNLSVKQLQSETIVEDVREALDSSGLPASNLVLEITESVMMVDTELAVERLAGLKELGVRLAMDDFGTGYSSLSYLSRLPVDILKMDRSFLAGETANTALAAAILNLGETLSLDVVAEGIERHDQMNTLRELGCELGQGFLFSRALTSEKLHAFLRSVDVSDPLDDATPEAA